MIGRLSNRVVKSAICHQNGQTSICRRNGQTSICRRNGQTSICNGIVNLWLQPCGLSNSEICNPADCQTYSRAVKIPLQYMIFNKQKLLIAALSGIIFGWPVGTYFFPKSSVEAIIPWGVFGLLMCFYFTKNVRESVVYGATYGLFLIVSFCLFNLDLKYSTQLVSCLLVLTGAAFLGIVCGAVCGVAGSLLHEVTKFRPNKS